MVSAMSTKTIAIAGAGIAGLLCAYRLQEAGHRVTLFDPNGFPASNASFKAGGMLAPYAEIEHMPPAFLEPCFESIRVWDALSKTSKNAFEFSQNGSLALAHPQDRHMLERFAAHLPSFQRLNGEDIERLEPSLTGRFREGLYLEGEAHLHPQKAMRWLADQIENKVSTAFEPGNFDHVIDCTGMAASAQDPDLRGVKGELIIVHNPDFSLSRPVRLMHPRYALYIVPRAGNMFMIGATNIESEGDARPSVKSVMELMSALVTLHPSFAEAKIIETQGDIRPSYPDNLPRIREAQNTIFVNGLYRHGYLLSPVLAECVLALVEGREYPYISFFRSSHESHHQRNPQGFHSAA